MNYNEIERKQLLELIDYSIDYGLINGNVPSIKLENFSSKLIEQRATFVTLKKKKNLRGCMGSLEADRELVIDVVQNAHAAAFRDPRFPSLKKDEVKELQIHLSVLSPYEKISIENEARLLQILRPGIDGLIIQDQKKRATFLPSVWESLTTPEVFVNKLKVKAGMAESYWSDDIEVFRYTAESIQ